MAEIEKGKLCLLCFPAEVGISCIQWLILKIWKHSVRNAVTYPLIWDWFHCVKLPGFRTWDSAHTHCCTCSKSHEMNLGPFLAVSRDSVLMTLDHTYKHLESIHVGFIVHEESVQNRTCHLWSGILFGAYCLQHFSGMVLFWKGKPGYMTFF